jgi:hypothetical protein
MLERAKRASMQGKSSQVRGQSHRGIQHGAWAYLPCHSMFSHAGRQACSNPVPLCTIHHTKRLGGLNICTCARLLACVLAVRRNGNLLLSTFLLGNTLVNNGVSILLADVTTGIIGLVVSTALVCAMEGSTHVHVEGDFADGSPGAALLSSTAACLAAQRNWAPNSIQPDPKCMQRNLRPCPPPPSSMQVLVFGELIPQAICSRHGLFIGAHAIWLVKFFRILFFPLTWPVSLVLDWALGQDIGTIYSTEEIKRLM